MKKRKWIILTLILLMAAVMTAASAFAEDTAQTVEIPEISGWDVDVYTNESKLWINTANFPDAVFRQYVLDHFDADGNYYIGYPEILGYEKISITGSPELKSLDGIWHFEGLRTLDITGSSVAEIPVNTLVYLESLYCRDTGITALNLTGCDRLTVLDCQNTPLKALDASPCYRLTDLYLTNTSLTSLDVTSLKYLKRLLITGTGITSVDLSGNPQLIHLSCSNLGLTSLDVSGQQKLQMLDCDQNQLKTLNLTQNTELTFLSCTKNQLSSLDLTAHTALLTIWWGNNPLLALNLPDNFSGGTESSDYVGTIEIPMDASGTIDLSKYAADIQADRIQGLTNAVVQNGTVIVPQAGNMVSYTYDCGGGYTLNCRFRAKSTTGTGFYLPADSVKLNGTEAVASLKETLDKVSGMMLIAQIEMAGETQLTLDLKSSGGTAESTSITSLGSFFSTVASSDIDTLQVETDHGIYTLIDAQMKAIAKCGNSSTLTITFSKSSKSGMDVIQITGGTSEGYLNGSAVSAQHPDAEAEEEAAEAEKEAAAAEAAKLEKMKSGVKATKITLTTTSGKGYIKLNWKKTAGYKVDYYEVFRSVKKNSEYGAKAFYRTTSGSKLSYKNTKSLKAGTRYYFKVRGVRVIDGKRYYTQWSNKSWKLAKK